MPIITPETIKNIAEELEIGMLCFYHKTTGEVESYPKELEYSGLEDMWEEVTDKIEANRDDYIEIEPMPGYLAFRVMEDFTNAVRDLRTRARLTDALSRKKPFRQFGDMLGYYPELRQEWFAYKTERYMEYVKDQIMDAFETEGEEDDDL